jgi:nitroimidazol reductase NimA-like FMN-containing flavoprotein (pyridoxamine 5'-phosphate oxidase superfamily)
VDEGLRQLILDLLRAHNTLVLATVRDDGYPQATTLIYANEGLTLYFAADRDSRKITNIRSCDKVSIAIARDYADWSQIRGLSMAGRAEVLETRDEVAHALAVLGAKFPAYAELMKPDDPGLAVVSITPTVISVLDYTRGFGHCDLVEV